MITSLKKGSALFSLGLLASCGCEAPQKKSSFVIVNVLDKELYEDCHIKGSINVPYDKLKEYASAHWDKNSTLVLYCANYRCSASADAAKMLVQELGFDKNNVFAYEGGAAEAHQLGITQGACKQNYLEDYEKPKDYDEQKKQIKVISSQELMKMMQKFGVITQS